MPIVPTATPATIDREPIAVSRRPIVHRMSDPVCFVCLTTSTARRGIV
jgi:hypothetical protein